MSKRKTLIDFLLLTVVLASFTATIVSGGFMVSAVLAHSSLIRRIALLTQVSLTH